MTPKEREVMEQALEALESCDSDYDWDGDGDEYQVDVYDRDKVNKAITAIKAALEAHKALMSQSDGAQPEQEPVAWPMEEQPDGSVIPIDPEEHPNFYTWTWDKFVSGGKWRAEYGWKKPEGFDFANLQPLYITPPPVTESHKRKPLTREQRIQIVKDNTVQGYHGDYFDAWGIIDDVEAAHGIHPTGFKE